MMNKIEKWVTGYIHIKKNEEFMIFVVWAAVSVTFLFSLLFN